MSKAHKFEVDEALDTIVDQNKLPSCYIETRNGTGENTKAISKYSYCGNTKCTIINQCGFTKLLRIKKNVRGLQWQK